MKDIRKSEEFQQQMDLKKESAATQKAVNMDKMAIEREKLASQREIANKQLEIARTNKTQYEIKQDNKK
jgi:lipopolysaccharide export system protein LptC